MIASCRCACRHPGPTVHAIGAEAAPAAVFVARLAAVRDGWAVPTERQATGTIEGVCPRCLAHRTVDTLHMESR